MQETITRDMTIEDVFKRFPGKSQKLAQEMSNAGLHCVGCSASTWETIEAGMYGHDMTDEQIESLPHRAGTQAGLTQRAVGQHSIAQPDLIPQTRTVRRVLHEQALECDLLGNCDQAIGIRDLRRIKTDRRKNIIKIKPLLAKNRTHDSRTVGVDQDRISTEILHVSIRTLSHAHRAQLAASLLRQDGAS